MSAPTPDAVDSLVCSAKGCQADATWALLWNNPRLHTPVRRKVWLACDEHREHLTSFLDLRGFLRDTVPADQIPTVDDAPGSPAGIGSPNGVGPPGAGSANPLGSVDVLGTPNHPNSADAANPEGGSRG